MDQTPQRPDDRPDEAGEGRRPVGGAGADPLGETDFADEHAGATFADQMPGGPEGEPEPETPHGYAGMEPRGPDRDRTDEPPPPEPPD